MEEVIEFTVESAEGIIDCRMERKNMRGEATCTLIVLYPHLVNGTVMSKVYEYNLIQDPKTGRYTFSDDALIHPAVKLLEKQISEAIIKNR